MKICNFEVGNRLPFFLIAGPCVIESEKLALESAEFLKECTSKLGINFIYKTSFEKANRTSVEGYAGLGFDEGMRILERVKNEFDIAILTDVHEDTPLNELTEVIDVLQTPAFLCRQTNFIKRVASQNKPVNLKKGQFLSPWEMDKVAKKAISTGNQSILLCERGATFGYNNLVVDMRSLEIMKKTGYPVVFDAGHSVQLPGGLGEATGGQREFIAPLAKAAVAVGIAGLYLETHPDPDRALCDGPNMLPLAELPKLLAVLQEIDQIVKKQST